MSNDKINIQEIVDLVSARLSISKKQIEEFFREFLPIIEDALKAGEVVKIKNFGTLKMQWNNPRKSVNVNTGEEIIIEGYNKVVFTPEESLKELVNEPFAHLFPIELDEMQTDKIPESGPLRVINEQALEIKNILSEINQLNTWNDNKESFEKDIDNNELDIIEIDKIENVDETENEKTATQNQESEQIPISENLELLPITEITTSENDSQPLLSENKTDVKEDDNQIDQLKNNDNEPEESALNAKTNEITSLINSKQDSEEFPSRSRLKWWLNGVAVVIGALILLYIFNLKFYRFVNDTVSSFVPAKKTLPEATVLLPDTVIVSDIDSDKIKEDLFYENLLKTNRNYGEVITIERTRKGTSLRELSEKYYGNQAFWIYIYEANMKEISDTSEFKRGTLLKIPVIDSLLTDISNKRTFAIAQNLTEELFAKQMKISEENKADEQQTETIIEKEPAVSKLEILATETMREGSRLTVFARKYFGSKYFWVYIYEANRDVIKNPDNVPVGTVIKIPKLDSKIIDLNNPESIIKAKELEKKYLKK